MACKRRCLNVLSATERRKRKRKDRSSLSNVLLQGSQEAIKGFILTKNLESFGVCDGMGGQGQYRVGRSSIGWAGAVSAVPLPLAWPWPWPFVFQSEKRMGSLYRRSRRVRKTKKNDDMQFPKSGKMTFIVVI